ncbi:alpha/beta-hydrolase [Hymenopellis radicata]|nr:alpha/beta-hydrolase [Hymenopellis radicata]
MPTIKAKSSSGSLVYNYTISTPTSPNAKTIHPALPTILFIHPVYIAQDIFQMQFGDANLRRFNLVALDIRGHGETGGRAPKKYGQEAAAEDIAKFMDALKLPPCHIFGLSMGTIIALQLAVQYPKKVLSLFMVSCLGLPEPQEVAEGRQEIADCWVEGQKNGDESALLDAVHGALQLGFNNHQSSMVSALTSRAVPYATKTWGGKDPKDMESYVTITVKFFTERKEHPKSNLSKIAVPVKLIHCMADIAYPLEYSERFLGDLKDAGVNASLDTVDDAPHFGSVTHSPIINPIIHDFIMAATSSPVPPAPSSATSPFEAGLVKAGWTDEDDD